MLPIKQELDKVSSCFCAAKWLQVTLRLQNGHNHSCHHPKTHKTPLSEIKKDFSALHNTKHKKLNRKKMLSGERPTECSYCWRIEDISSDLVSDRYIKSSDSWAHPYLNKISQFPWDANVKPTYLEVSFSNACNFSCAYCFPDVSTKIMAESVKHGPYPTSDLFGSLVSLKIDKTMPLPEDKNPYIEAFWKWLPDLIDNLHELRVTGGEPLLSRHTKKLLDFIEDNPCPNLIVSINSNLGVHTKLVEQTLEKLESLYNKKKIKGVNIFTSIDTWGEQAEYIRNGLSLELWKKNLELCLQKNKFIHTHIMVAFNVLSLFGFEELLKYYLEKKREYKKLNIDISIVHSPVFLNILTLGAEAEKRIANIYNYMLANSAKKCSEGYGDYELNKVKRLLEYSKTKLLDYEVIRHQNDFRSFVQEYDRRKNKNFSQIFPELWIIMQKWQKKQINVRLKQIAHKIFGKIYFKYYNWKQT